MNIVIASDSFKGSCSSVEVANSIEKGLKRIINDVNVLKIPVADGGEGTVDALVIGTNGSYENVQVTGPLGDNIWVKYGIINDKVAVIEMAAASGITLIKKDKLNPLITTTYGTGELIRDAIDKGIREIYLGLGGSATNDAGVGMAQALGVSFQDKDGNEIGPGGGQLNRIDKIITDNIHSELINTKFTVITDVDNPLCGEKGASYIFGPQKGADSEMIRVLDKNFSYYGNMVEKRLGKSIIETPGIGAAGGLAVSLFLFGNSLIKSGIYTILDLVGFDNYLQKADIVITGEGRIDSQSIFGKVPVGISKRASKYNKPVIAVVGSVGKGASRVYSHGIDLILDIVNKPMMLEEAIDRAPELLEEAGENVGRILKLFRRYDKKQLVICQDNIFKEKIRLL